MARADVNVFLNDNDALRLNSLLNHSIQENLFGWSGVFCWLYPTLTTKQCYRFVHEIALAPGEEGWSPRSERQYWRLLQTLFPLIDKIAARNRVRATSDLPINDIRRLSGPYFNWTPIACLIHLKRLQDSSRSSANRKLLDKLYVYYEGVVDIMLELRSSTLEIDLGLASWLKCFEYKDIHSLLDRLLSAARNAAQGRTASGALSKATITAYFRYLDKIAQKNNADDRPPNDAVALSWVMISEHVSTLDDKAWKKWQSALVAKCRHPGVKEVIYGIDQPRKLEETDCLEELLIGYVNP